MLILEVNETGRSLICMPPKRSKKRSKAGDSKAALCQDVNTDVSEQAKDPCHNQQSVAHSSSVQDAAAKAWRWQSMQQRDVEKALQHLLKDSIDGKRIFSSFIKSYIAALQCGMCTENLAGVLVAQPERASLVAPTGVAALEHCAGLIQAAGSEHIDSSSIEFSPASAAELALCAGKPGALLQPADDRSSAKPVRLMCEELTQIGKRAVKLYAVDARLHAIGADAWLAADAVLHEWLGHLAVTVETASSVATMAFLTCSASECAQLADAAATLLAHYKQAIDTLRACNVQYKEQQLLANQAPAAVRGAMQKVQAARSEAVAGLHDEVQRILSGAGVAALLQRVEPLRDQWKALLLLPDREQNSSSMSLCDELHLQLLQQQVRQCSCASAPVAPADWRQSSADDADQEAVLVKGRHKLDSELSCCRRIMAAFASHQLQAERYPQTTADLQAFQRWQAEYERGFSALEQHTSDLADEYRQQRQMEAVVYAKACADLSAAESGYKVYRDLADRGAVGADSLCSGLAEQKEALTLQVLLRQQEKALTAAQCSSSLVSLLSQRYWLTRQYCAQLCAHAAVRALRVERLCGGSAAAERRLEVIQACCTLEAADSACKEWLAQQCELQLLEEADAASAAQQQQQRKGKKGRGKQGAVTVTSETVEGDTATAATAAAAATLSRVHSSSGSNIALLAPRSMQQQALQHSNELSSSASTAAESRDVAQQHLTSAADRVSDSNSSNSSSSSSSRVTLHELALTDESNSAAACSSGASPQLQLLRQQYTVQSPNSAAATAAAAVAVAMEAMQAAEAAAAASTAVAGESTATATTSEVVCDSADSLTAPADASSQSCLSDGSSSSGSAVLHGVGASQQQQQQQQPMAMPLAAALVTVQQTAAAALPQRTAANSDTDDSSSDTDEQMPPLMLYVHDSPQAAAAAAPAPAAAVAAAADRSGLLTSSSDSAAIGAQQQQQLAAVPAAAAARAVPAVATAAAVCTQVSSTLQRPLMLLLHIKRVQRPVRARATGWRLKRTYHAAQAALDTAKARSAKWHTTEAARTRAAACCTAEVAHARAASRAKTMSTKTHLQKLIAAVRATRRQAAAVRASGAAVAAHNRALKNLRVAALAVIAWRRRADARARAYLHMVAVTEAAALTGSTQLHAAAKRGNGVVVDYLLRQGSDTAALDSSGRTALLVAVLHGQYRVLQLLLRAGADATAADAKGNTALHYLVRTANFRPAMCMLLKAGADINAQNAGKETPLFSLCWSLHWCDSYAAALLKAGADQVLINRTGTLQSVTVAADTSAAQRCRPAWRCYYCCCRYCCCYCCAAACPYTTCNASYYTLMLHLVVTGNHRAHVLACSTRAGKGWTGVSVAGYCLAEHTGQQGSGPVLLFRFLWHAKCTDDDW
jgi:Ankyrin repeats (3 copies)